MAKKVDERINNHIAKCLSSSSSYLSEPDLKPLREALRTICGRIDFWHRTDAEVLKYQMFVAEAPHAVTWKEFDAFLAVWSSDQTTDTIAAWIASHSIETAKPHAAIGRELVEATVGRFFSKHRDANSAFDPKKARRHKMEAKSLLTVLDSLLFGLGDLDPDLLLRDWVPLSLLFTQFSSLADESPSSRREIWPQAQQILLRLARSWNGDSNTLIRAIFPHRLGEIFRTEGRGAQKLLKMLGDVAVDQLARTIPSRFKEPNFVEMVSRQSEGLGDIRSLLLKHDGPLWTGQRKAILAVLKGSKANPNVQQNAYAMLEWYGYLFQEEGVGTEASEAAQVVKAQREVILGLWAAVTADPFSRRYVHRLKQLPDKLRQLGVEVQLPSWWQFGVDGRIAEYAEEVQAHREAQDCASS